MITVKDLVFTYPKTEAPTLKGISFEIRAGEIFGFLGPSGAGKSTTQKVLTRLATGYQGEVIILNRDLREWGTDFYEHIGVGFELPNHYGKLTAMENLRFFASFYKRKPEDPMRLLEMVGLRYDAKKKVQEYSKGMKMRLNFVRALIHDPQILFLDEPTSGLDPRNARAIKDIITIQRDKGKTVFLTTHNMYDADELCDRVAFIVDGEVKIVDSPRNLKLQAGERKVTVEYQDNEARKIRTQQFPLDRLGDNQQFLSLIREKTILSIHTAEATLEEVFIGVTGRHLE